MSYISPETLEIARLVYLVEDTGNLLFEGGWAAQPFWLVEAFEIYKYESIKSIKEKGNG
ncbi:MAG: hypothetical protein HYS21_13685 [Deltaproteobacteria bacterium]|nr:hypothetical protein [Deltaproteobacteria bacterium]